MTNEREILEACAKVMGYLNWTPMESNGLFIERGSRRGSGIGFYWNPLHSLADAAAMAVKLKVDVIFDESVIAAEKWDRFNGVLLLQEKVRYQDHHTKEAAYCWAVCQVVSQMGETK